VGAGRLPLQPEQRAMAVEQLATGLTPYVVHNNVMEKFWDKTQPGKKFVLQLVQVCTPLPFL
jgi:hypothetical protein